MEYYADINILLLVRNKNLKGKETYFSIRKYVPNINAVNLCLKIINIVLKFRFLVK